MEIKDIMKDNVAALVEFYDNSPACDAANRLVEEVKDIMGADAPVYRIDLNGNRRESAAVHIDTVPTLVIYRNHREEWRLTSDFPSAEVLAERLKESMQPAGAVNPLKGRPRHL